MWWLPLLESLFQGVLYPILSALNALTSEVNHMASVLAGLTSAIEALQAQQTANQATFEALAAAATQVDNDIVALIAKVGAGNVDPAELASDLAAVQQITSAQAQGATTLAGVTSGLTAADAAANTPAPVPAAPPAAS